MDCILDPETFLELFNDFKNRADINNFIIISIDLDRSKQIFGGPLPTEAKTLIMEEIAHQFPDFYVTPFGNDTFTLMCTNEKHNLIEIGQQKQRLQDALSQSFQDHLTFCWGVASYPLHSKNKHELLSISFESLNQAKSIGPGQVQLFESSPMKLKSAYFRKGQLENLTILSTKIKKGESEILREALDSYLQEKLYFD